MPYFTKTIEADRGFMNFYFNRIYTAEGMRYHISVVDRNGKSIIFHMEKKGTEWCLIENDSTKDWIKTIEKKLSGAIIEHMGTV